MDEISTDTLRKLAPRWTLAGDERLLTILQNTHKRLVSRCQQTSCQLEQMTSALDDASIHLHNVNNQFMSLSSSQFIESRVYDDDVDVTTDNNTVKESPAPSLPDELAMLKRSVDVITNTHEVITIVDDSDSDSDDDVTDRQVLKPKDMYEERPLPYIIGSEPWKNKWHAGLVLEDSDTDSCTSKVDRDSDEYSHSEPEDFAPHSAVGLRDNVQEDRRTNLSESSCEAPAASVSTPTPAHVATDIATTLGAAATNRMSVRETEYEEPSAPSVTKIYRPQEPVASTIFPDEPPPLDEQTDSDTDIFAELQRNQPYRQTYRTDVARDLFASGGDTDIFSDFANQPPVTKPTSLFEAGPKPHMFDKQHVTTEHIDQTTVNTTHTDTVDSSDDRIKKPVGGISLFGSSKGAENIGAAILKRHQRQSSSSDDGSGSETPPKPNKQQTKKEKDIFDDLFAKNENNKKTNNNSNSIVQEIQRKNQEKVKKETPKPVDLFSDNLFDDIDDIFTTNVVKTTKNNKSTVFEDEDALFSEISEQKVFKTNHVLSNNKEKKGLFDSDDDLFLEKPKIDSKTQPSKIVSETIKSTTVNKVVQPNKVVNTTSLFDDDEDNIFSDTKVSEVITSKAKENTNSMKAVETSKNVFSSPSLFDEDDDDSNDLFKDTIKSPNVLTNKSKDDAKYKNTSKKEVKFVENKSELETKPDEAIGSVLKSADKSSNYIEKTNQSPPEIVTNEINRKIVDQEKDATTFKNKNDFDIEKPLKDNIINKSLETRHSDLDNTSVSSEISESILNEENYIGEPKVNNKVDDVINETVSQSINKVATPENNKVPINVHDIVNDSSEININDDNSNKTLNPDIFSDIVSEPPVFEKPKEPKRSKNVNALFDDDSDDETLFFKKDDVVSDDNQEEFTPNQNTLFDIFTDLPPEEHINEINDNLDDGLFNSNTLVKNNASESEGSVEQKGSGTVVSNAKETVGDIFKLLNEETPENTPPIEDEEDEWAVDDKESISVIVKPKAVGDVIDTSTDKTIKKSQLFKGIDSDNDTFKNITNSSNILKKDIFSSDDDEQLFQSLPVDICKLPPQISETKNLKNDYKADDEQFQSLPNMNTTQLDNEKFAGDINDHDKNNTESVAEKTDKKVGKLKIGLNINVKALLPGASPIKIRNIDSLDGQTQSHVKVDNEDVKPVETVGFAGKLNSEILDNKLSKERPRIQVKRRPSTRKARKEAVRKSGINFGDDSTDNSSSIDDPPKEQNETQHSVETVEANIQDSEFKNLTDEELVINDTEKLKEKTEIIESDKPLYKDETQTENSNSILNQPVKSTSTTKIVYILNDEDIFNTSNIETGPKTTDNTESNITENSNESTKLNESHSEESPIKTLGKTYDTKDNTNTSTYGTKSNGNPLFDDDDDEIFRNKKPTVKASIFDSDSDGELFGGSKKTEVRKIDKVQVKGSLFGDDDDDDLFGVNTKKNNDPQPAQPKSVPSVKETTPCTLPVFEDPLSVFKDEE